MCVKEEIGYDVFAISIPSLASPLKDSCFEVGACEYFIIVPAPGKQNPIS